MNENGKVVRNKTKLIVQGYSTQEGIDFTETFTLIARIEVIRILLSFVAQHDRRLYQMNLKSAFLNGILNEEVCVEQLPTFEDQTFPN